MQNECFLEVSQKEGKLHKGKDNYDKLRGQVVQIDGMSWDGGGEGGADEKLIGGQIASETVALPPFYM